MSTMNYFMKQNLKTKENVKFAPTKNLCDENGFPLEWEIKPLTTKEDNAIRNACMYDVPVTGKPNQFRPTLNVNQYLVKTLTASVVFPDLLDAELQDSYGVKTAEDLLIEMIYEPKEFNDFAMFVQQFNGVNVGVDEKIDKAKN